MPTPTRRRVLLGGGGFDPRTIPNLAFWFKADRITGKVDGDAISQWDDLSGNGHHAVQASGTKQPLYKVGIKNGKPMLLFDATDDNLRTTDTVTVNVAGVTIFVIASTGAGSYATIVETGAVYTDNYGFFLSRDTTDRALAGSLGNVGSTICNSTGVSISTIRQLTLVIDRSLTSNEAQLYSNGVNVSTVTNNGNNTNNILTTAAKINLGSRNAGASLPMNGYFGELIGVLRATPDAERQVIEAYLRKEWETT